MTDVERPTLNLGMLRLHVGEGQTVNEVVAEVMLRASWKDESTPILACVLSDVTDFASFAASCGPSWVAAGRPESAILFPASIQIGETLYGPVTVPTMHIFAVTQAAARPLMMAARSDCQKTLMRLLGLNRQISGIAVPCDPPKATTSIHDFRPSVGEP